jgi:2-oxoglutarate dehydrogenase E1 component
MSDFSYVFNAHPSYIDAMYKKYKDSPATLEDGWRTFFEGFEFAASVNGSISTPQAYSMNTKELQVIGLINGYRRRGHLLSTTNPIRTRQDRTPMLDLGDYGLDDGDLDKKFYAGKDIGLQDATLRQIIDRLNKIYCGNIGLEYFYIEKQPTRRWLRERLENFNENSYGFDLEKKKHILRKLNGAVGFESFLNKKYVGQKRFSLEGGESTIPALDAIINLAGDMGVEEVIMGMAHRGRLNVLANILGKTYDHIFNEFEGTAVPDLAFGDGDVKYHLGYSSQVEIPGGKKIHVKLSPNPSHLESVNPVVEGFARAKADLLYGEDNAKVLPILIHGDAAIAGQGVVYEVLQMSKLEGFSTGGTIHFVINNQIGFTTDYQDARSSTYCTSIAATIQAPVLHVNGDDPEAVVFAAELAVEWRQKFHSDIFIDMVCYRRHGHNEGDDPKFTQPMMYDIIKKHPNTRQVYAKQLTEKGDIEASVVKQMDTEFNQFLQERFDMVKQKALPYQYQKPELIWKKLKHKATAQDFLVSPLTGVKEDMVRKIEKHLLQIPKAFNSLSKVKRLYDGTRSMIKENRYDWAMAELMAYGTLLQEGYDVRMSGQDVKRGTFSHRHAVLVDTGDKEEYNRLSHLEGNKGKFRIFNSLLSEFAVLGFEFGYSMANPESLVIWEAQFGDFYNGAQVIVDQFIVSSESKWDRMSGLVLFLPHGYTGQGPEHSSARLERFLQQCAEFNMTVANVTTPANFFHLLRRQMIRPFRKPLIVMSPKSLLRHERCVSGIEDFTGQTRFEEVIDDPVSGLHPKKVKRVLLCSGKLYYELLERQEHDKRHDIAIIRMEQLYPFPLQQIEALSAKYKDAEAYWVQEEPSNMGAWQYIWAFYRPKNLKLVSRKSSASPATGFKKVHDQQQQDIIDQAFA